MPSTEQRSVRLTYSPFYSELPFGVAFQRLHSGQITAQIRAVLSLVCLLHWKNIILIHLVIVSRFLFLRR